MFSESVVKPRCRFSSHIRIQGKKIDPTPDKVNKIIQTTSRFLYPVEQVADRTNRRMDFRRIYRGYCRQPEHRRWKTVDLLFHPS